METPAAPVTEAELNQFVASCKGISDAYMDKHFPTLSKPVFSVMPGKRYARIVRTETSGSSRSVHCFVDMTNGDILKAASWKAPAKHARGNIRNPSGIGSAMTPYGAAYLR